MADNHKSILNGKSLSHLTGASSRTFEQVHVPVKSLEEILAEIRRLGATGALTINFSSGSARGTATWEGETGEKKT